MLMQLFPQYRAFLWGVPSEDPRVLPPSGGDQSKQKCLCQCLWSSVYWCGEAANPWWHWSCGTWDPIRACPKIEQLVWDSLFNISNPTYSQHCILLLTGNERQVQEVLHPLTYLLTSLLRHSYNIAIPVHHFYPIIKFWASHHCHGKCTCQTCRGKGDFALIDPKALPQ